MITSNITPPGAAVKALPLAPMLAATRALGAGQDQQDKQDV